jgi:acyl-CoA hydrolase
MLGPMEAKRPSESFTEMTELVLPQHANAIGTAFGGVIMSWIDICSSIAAKRHCGRVCVTARVDALEFKEPIKVGDVVRLTARLNAAFTTSMEIGVRVERESATMGRALCADARATFVNIGEDGKPHPVPPLLAENAEDQRLAREAVERRRQRREAERRA